MLRDVGNEFRLIAVRCVTVGSVTMWAIAVIIAVIVVMGRTWSIAVTAAKGRTRYIVVWCPWCVSVSISI